MDQNFALTVKVVNCIGCWKKFCEECVCDAKIWLHNTNRRRDTFCAGGGRVVSCPTRWNLYFPTQIRNIAHSVLVVVEGPASDWSSVKTTLLHTQYPVGLCVLVNTNLSERGICRKARREFLTPGWYALREGCRQNLISQKTSVTDDTVVVPSNSFLGAFPSLMKTDFNPTNVKGHKNVIKNLIWSPPLNNHT